MDGYVKDGYTTLEKAENKFKKKIKSDINQIKKGGKKSE